MPLSIFGAQAAVSILNRVFTNTSPAASVFNNQVSNATASLPADADSTNVLSYTAFAKTFGTAYASQSPSALSTLILTNMGLLPNDGLQVGLADYLTNVGKENVGIVALQLSSIISGMGSDAIYGAASVAWNSEVTSAFAYSSNPANTTSQTGDVTAPPANQGQTFTLTANADSFTGGAGDDIFNAIVSATAGTTTATTGDVLTGGAGTDTLNITVASTANPGLLQTSGIEKLSVRALGDASIDMLLVNDVTLLTSNGGTNDVTVTNGQLATVYSVSNTITSAGATADLTVGYRAVDVLGSADAAKLSIEAVGSAVTAAGATTPTVVRSVLTVGAGVESIDLATKGTNYAQVEGTSTVATLNVTGDGTNNITVGTLKAASTIDASTATGANTINVGSGLSTGDVVKGGTGADTLTFTAANTATVTVSGVETLQVNGGTATTTFSANPAATTLNVRSTDATAMTGITTLSNLNYQGDQLATYAGTSGNVTLNTAFAGTADALAIGVGNRGVTANGSYNIGTLKVSGVEGITLTQSDMLATGTTTATIHDTGLKTLAATTAGNLALTLSTVASSAPGAAAYTGTTAEPGSNSVTLVDFSGVAGTANITFETTTFAAAAEIKAAVGGSTITLSGSEAATDSITFTGGAGVDSFTTGTSGSFIANLGGGSTNTFNAGALIAATTGNTVNVTGGDGADTITGGANADSIVGGAGNDIITGGRGADTINGGLGADTYRVALGAAATTGTAEVQTITAATDGTANSANTYLVNILGTTVQFTTDASPTAAEFTAGMTAALNAAAAGRYVAADNNGAVAGQIVITYALAQGDAAAATVQVLNSATAAGATATHTNGLGLTVATGTPGVAPTAATASDSASTGIDQLTYVSNADIIDVVAGNIVINGGDAATAAAAGNANITATGLATFHANDNTLALKLTAIAADLDATAAAREAAVFVDQGQAYLYISDGVAGHTTADAVIALVGITTLANGMTLAGGDITAIS